MRVIETTFDSTSLTQLLPSTVAVETSFRSFARQRLATRRIRPSHVISLSVSVSRSLGLSVSMSLGLFLFLSLSFSLSLSFFSLYFTHLDDTDISVIGSSMKLVVCNHS